MTLARRKLRVTISDPKSGVTATLPDGLRMSAVLQHAGGAADGQMFLSVWGMSRSLMNQLSTCGVKLNIVQKFPIVLEAGDDDNGLSTVFVGNLLTGAADFNALPDVRFDITAHCALAQAVTPIPSTSFHGSTDVATIMSGLATKMGLRFENSGVTTKLQNPFFSGSAYAQMQAVAEHAGINASVINGVLCIWPKFGSRNGQVPVISPDTGMVGYPTFTALGIMVRTLYNHSIGLGQKVRVESSITPATGNYTVYSLTHELECEVPGGKWLTTALCFNPRVPAPPRIGGAP